MEYNVRAEDFEGNVLNIKTTPKQAGLGNVKNYPINSNINANSDEEYASTSMVAKVREEKVSKSDIINNLTTGGTNKPLSAEQGKIIKQEMRTPNNQVHYDTDGIYRTALNDIKKHIAFALVSNGDNSNTGTIPNIGNQFLYIIQTYYGPNKENVLQIAHPYRNEGLFTRIRNGSNNAWTAWRKYATIDTLALNKEAEQKLIQLELEALNE